MKSDAIHVALIGGGPSALFMYKRLIEAKANVKVTIFEKSDRLGAGMPYSSCGTGEEHVTNVSSNEIPQLPIAPQQWLEQYAKSTGDTTYLQYSPYKVFPRKLFGNYLEAQFHTLIEMADGSGIETEVYLNTLVADIQYVNRKVKIIIANGNVHRFDKVVICTGHQFPTGQDEASTGYYHSPYPPQKLSLSLNHPIAVRGASLTAVDAIKTLARANGSFHKKENGLVTYMVNPQNPYFKIVLHCRSGMLPAVRFHLADSRLKNPSLLTPEQIEKHKKQNGGFLSLDYIFDKDFKEPLKASDPAFYEKIKNYTMEEFVQAMLELRERINPFTLLKAECHEADKSIKRRESIHWKEMLGVLSFAMNYPAKYFSAEDMIRYKNTLHPLISLVIAYIPQSSCKELLALHKAGCLELVNVGKKSWVEKRAGKGIVYHYNDEKGCDRQVEYKMYIDCTGQPQINFKDFPFNGLIFGGIVSQARLAFQDARLALRYYKEHPGDVEVGIDGRYYLKVSGISVNDYFQVIGESGLPNDAIYMMAVPYMGGYNPDYSGLDFAEEASGRIIKKMMREPMPIDFKAEVSGERKKPLNKVA